MDARRADRPDTPTDDLAATGPHCRRRRARRRRHRLQLAAGAAGSSPDPRGVPRSKGRRRRAGGFAPPGARVGARRAVAAGSGRRGRGSGESAARRRHRRRAGRRGYEPPLAIQARIATDRESRARSPRSCRGKSLPRRQPPRVRRPPSAVRHSPTPTSSASSRCSPPEPVTAGALAAGLHARLGNAAALVRTARRRHAVAAAQVRHRRGILRSRRVPAARGPHGRGERDRCSTPLSAWSADIAAALAGGGRRAGRRAPRPRGPRRSTASAPISTCRSASPCSRPDRRRSRARGCAASPRPPGSASPAAGASTGCRRRRARSCTRCRTTGRSRSPRTRCA